MLVTSGCLSLCSGVCVKCAQLREFYSLVIACGPFLKIMPSGVDMIPRDISALPITAISALLKQHLHRVRSFKGLKHRQHENVARSKATIRESYLICNLIKKTLSLERGFVSSFLVYHFCKKPFFFGSMLLGSTQCP